MKTTILALLSVVLPLSLAARPGDYGMTSFPVLMAGGGGARALSLAESAVAIGDDLSLLSVNPAALAGVTQASFNAQRMGWLFDTSYFGAHFAWPLGEAGTVAVSTVVFSIDDFAVIDDGVSGGSFANGDLLIGASWAKRFGGALDAGVSLKFAHSSLADYGASVLAFDLGVRYGLAVPGVGKTVGNRLFFGLAFRNLALVLSDFTSTSDTRVPWYLDFGFLYHVLQDERHLVSLTTSLQKPRDNDLFLSSGLEYAYKKTIFVRFGYHFLGREEDGFTLGVGLDFELTDKLAFRVDYSSKALGEFGRSEVFAFSMKF